MMLTLGNFVGPTASGFSVEAYGFEWTTVVFFAMYCIILVVDAFLGEMFAGPDLLLF